jgi:hypothetical protein
VLGVQVRGRERPSRLAPATIRTTGWIRVWAVDDEMYESMEAHRQLYWYGRNRQMTSRTR